MKILCTSDFHIGLNSEHDNDIIAGCREIAGYIQKNQIDLIFITGDIYDKPRPTPLMNNRFGDCLTLIGNVPIFIISGNHDITSQYSTVETFQAPVFSHTRSLHFINKPKAYQFGDKKILFLPFESVKDFGFIVSQYINNSDVSYDIVVTHTDIPGSIQGAEREIQLGDVGSLTALANSRVKMLIAGHVHTHQSGVFSKVPFIYPGSLARTSHSEEREEKGFIVYDTQSQTFEFVKRKTTRKWATVNIDWKGSLPVIKTKADVIRININSPIKYRGAIDRIGIEKKLLQQYGQVHLNIEYDRKISTKAKKVAKGLSFDEYEDEWIELNAKGHKAEVKKRIKKIMASLEDSKKRNCAYAGMALKEMHLENFQSIGKASRKFGVNDCTGILGMFNGKLTKSNGTGKSSFVEAIPWILNNSTRYSKNNSLVMDGEKEAKGWVILETSKGESIRIERKQRATASVSECSVIKFPESYKSHNELLAQGKEVAKWVEDNGGLSSKAFDALIYIGDNAHHSIVGAKPTDRLRMLQEPLPLERYTKYALEKIKVSRHENKANLDQLRGVIQEYEGLLDEDIDISAKEIERNGLKKQVGLAEAEITVLQREIDKLDEDIKLAWEKEKINIDLKEINSELESRTKEYDELQKKEIADIVPVEQDIVDITAKMKSLAEQLSNIQAAGEVQKNIMESLQEELAEVEKAESKATENCPVCGQKWSEESREAHRKKISDKYSAASEKRDQLANQYREIKSEREKLSKKGSELEEIKTEIHAHSEALAQIKADIDEMRKEQKSLEMKESKIKVTDSYQVIEKSKNAYKKKIEDKRESVQELREELNEISQEISIYTQNVARLKLAQTRVKKAEKENTILNICYDAFSVKGIPQFIIMNIIEEINLTIPNVINDFSFWQDIDVIVEPDINKTNSPISILAKIGNKQKREYEGLSHGEKEITNFIFTMAYREVLTNLIDINYSFILIDEALDALDEENMKAAIRYFKKAKLQSFCISHSDLKDIFSKTVIVNNANGIAEIL